MGENPTRPFWVVAQLVERRSVKPLVVGSSPTHPGCGVEVGRVVRLDLAPFPLGESYGDEE